MLRRKKLRRSQASQILRAELGALRPIYVNGKCVDVSSYISANAFCQYVLRHIRAYAEKLTDVQRSAAPPILAGRPGNELRRANPKDVFCMRATWPFHLAGDSEASLFGQRAWLSWRFLALLELPKLDIWELPMQSGELQNLITSTRSSACSVASLDAQAVLQILLEFLNDPRGNNAKARWLHRAVVTSGCLLYTSPSPRDKRQSRMPSSA